MQLSLDLFGQSAYEKYIPNLSTFIVETLELVRKIPSKYGVHEVRLHWFTIFDKVFFTRRAYFVGLFAFLKNFNALKFTLEFLLSKFF